MDERPKSSPKPTNFTVRGARPSRYRLGYRLGRCGRRLAGHLFQFYTIPIEAFRCRANIRRGFGKRPGRPRPAPPVRPRCRDHKEAPAISTVRGHNHPLDHRHRFDSNIDEPTAGMACHSRPLMVEPLLTETVDSLEFASSLSSQYCSASLIPPACNPAVPILARQDSCVPSCYRLAVRLLWSLAAPALSA